uniref:Acetylserotonin O-methyltransferase variant 3 n=1 Tax=Rattus norvegicus TaxID=10116 RepID=A0A3G1CV17_RAT|nr:acetylserotonin O-methyltransferase variant 3 [Rattus norvegicus]
MAPGREGELDRDFRVLMSLAHGFMVSQAPTPTLRCHPHSW